MVSAEFKCVQCLSVVSFRLHGHFHVHALHRMEFLDSLEVFPGTIVSLHRWLGPPYAKPAEINWVRVSIHNRQIDAVLYFQQICKTTRGKYYRRSLKVL